MVYHTVLCICKAVYIEDLPLDSCIYHGIHYPCDIQTLKLQCTPFEQVVKFSTLAAILENQDQDPLLCTTHIMQETVELEMGWVTNSIHIGTQHVMCVYTVIGGSRGRTRCPPPRPKICQVYILGPFYNKLA